MKKEIVFDRQDTKAIKGIAVLLMLLLHLVCPTDRYPNEFEGFVSFIPGLVESVYFFPLMNESILCVPIFFFLGGYGLWIRMESGKFNMKNTILGLYQAYWKVFFLFIPIGLIFFSRTIANGNDYVNILSSLGTVELITVLISDFTGLTCTINGQWWFFGTYLCTMILGYLFCKYIRKANDFWAEMLIAFGIDMLIRSVIPQIPNMALFSDIKDNFLYAFFMASSSFAPCFYAGCVMAKHNGICKIKEMILALPFHTVLSAVGIGALILLRCFVMGANIDILICTLLISMLSVILDSLKSLKKLFVFFGKHSTNMWLNHAFFCFYFYEFTLLVYVTRSIVVDFLILVTLSLTASVLTDVFYAYLGKFLNRFRQNAAKPIEHSGSVR